MKKIICLIAASLGVAAGVNAQKNTVLLYGDLGFNSSKAANDFVNKGGSFNIGAGYQFDHNWTVGLTGGYGGQKQRANDEIAWDVNENYRIAPFVRYTRPLNDLFFFYTQAEFGYFGTSTGVSNSNTRVNSNGTYASLVPAVGMKLGRGWAFQFNVGGLGYTTSKFEGATASDKGFAFTLGQQVNAGVAWNIHCKKGFKSHNNKEKDNDGYNSWKNDRKK